MDLLKLPYEHHFSHEWKIKKSDLETLKTTKYGHIFSKDYFASKIADTRYYFGIYPNGYNDKNEAYTFIYFFLDSEDIENFEAKYKISIEAVNIRKSFEYVHKSCKPHGIMCCKSDKLFNSDKSCFIDDEFVMKVNGTLKFARPLVSKTVYPISAKWIIKSSEFEPEANACLDSKNFKILSNSNIEYFLRIFPNGENEKHRGKVAVYLQLILKKETKIRAIGNFSFNSGKWAETFYGLYENSTGYGMVLCSTEDLFDVKKGYLVNGELAISFDGHLFVVKKDREFTLLDNGINDGTFTSTSQEKNFKIIVGEHDIDVNKESLADVSTVFARMLQSGMKETIEGKMEITDFPYKTVDAAVKLIYGISPTFTLDDMLPLLVFSDKYDIQIIKDLVENHLIKELSTSNVCQLIHFSTLFNAQKLYEKSAELFIQCSQNSTFVNDLDLIDKEMFYKIFHGTFPSDC